MTFKFYKSAQYIILQSKDEKTCYVAISSSGHTSHELSGLYMYHGCKHDQVESDEEGRLIIDGVDEI